MDFSLIVDYMRGLFTVVKFSEKGSNNHEREEEAYMFFLDNMDECCELLYVVCNGRFLHHPKCHVQKRTYTRIYGFP